MLRTGTLLMAVAASLLGAFALHQSGWFSPSPIPVGSHVNIEAVDTAKLPTVVRYRQGQMRHWRACLLNH